MVSWNPATSNGFYCNIKKIIIGHITVYQPDIAFFAICGALIGFTGFITILRRWKHLQNHETYAIIFFIFGCMNSSGLLANSIFMWGAGYSSPASQWVNLIDGICSSAVSLTFIYCGLVDVGILKDGSWLTRLILLGSYLALAYYWYLNNHGKIPNGFQILYTDVTEVGSLVFFLLSFVWFYQHKTLRGIEWLVLAGVSGVIGILVLLQKLGDLCYLKFQVPFTSIELPLPNGGGIWYFFSDLSLVGFLFFYLASKSIQQPKDEKETSEKLSLLTGIEIQSQQ